MMMMMMMMMMMVMTMIILLLLLLLLLLIIILIIMTIINIIIIIVIIIIIIIMVIVQNKQTNLRLVLPSPQDEVLGPDASGAAAELSGESKAFNIVFYQARRALECCLAARPGQDCF